MRRSSILKSADPRAFGSRLNFWIDASDTNSLNISDGTATANDKSGKGYHTTSSTPPSLGTIASKPALIFNGYGQYLSVPLAAFPGQTNFTIIGVFQGSSTSSGGAYPAGCGLINISYNGDNPEIRFLAGDLILAYWNGDYLYKPSATINRSVFELSYVIGGYSSCSRNGSLLGSGTRSGTWNAINEFSIGRYNLISAFRAGNLQELIIINGLCRDAELAKLRNYLNKKWSVY